MLTGPLVPQTALVTEPTASETTLQGSLVSAEEVITTDFPNSQEGKEGENPELRFPLRGNVKMPPSRPRLSCIHTFARENTGMVLIKPLIT